jgi:hypothetical protein
MHEYFAGQLAQDRRTDLHREAAEARLARTAGLSRRRSRTTVPTRSHGVRASLRLFLGRAAI